MAARVIVVGSGAAGLAAALSAREHGATVTLLESTDSVGGTTALSGGVAWIPANHRSSEIGFDDDLDAARTYLRSVALGDVDEALIDRFVEHGPVVARWVEAATGLRWLPLPYPDYHSDFPGGREGGRSLEPDPFAPDPDVAALLRAPLSWRLPVTQSEVVLNRVKRSEIERRQREGIVTMGVALVAALLHAARTQGTEVRTDARACRLVVEGPTVAGIELASGETLPGSVVLASGGFERDDALARGFLRAPARGLTGAPGARGDGLRMAMAAGADLGNMSEAWWCPTIRIPDDSIDGEPLHRLILNERARPGSLMVDARGRRFANEAQNYNDVGRSLHAFDPGGFAFERDPSWLIFDASYRRSYDIGPVLRDDPDPDWMVRADTLAELATAVGVPSESLTATIERFNVAASKGQDPDFERGVRAYDRFVGDPAAAHPNLRPLDSAPFYALRIVPGLLGTKGGPRTDVDGRVRHVEGGHISGLYAAGNAAASPMGMAYPGAGGTIGPALTFGHLAGVAAARD